jgi:hypothetical protein
MIIPIHIRTVKQILKNKYNINNLIIKKMSQKWNYFIGGFGVGALIAALIWTIDEKLNYTKKTQ